jgi:hypothetical protein
VEDNWFLLTPWRLCKVASGLSPSRRTPSKWGWDRRNLIPAGAQTHLCNERQELVNCRCSVQTQSGCQTPLLVSVLKLILVYLSCRFLPTSDPAAESNEERFEQAAPEAHEEVCSHPGWTPVAHSARSTLTSAGFQRASAGLDR